MDNLGINAMTDILNDRTIDLENESVFSALVEAVRSRLIAITLLMTHNREDAEDAVQEACMEAYLQRHQFMGQAAPHTWLHRIAVNEVLQNQRKSRALRRGGTSLVSLDSTLEGVVPESHGHEHRLYALVLVNSLLDKLSERERLLLMMHHGEDWRLHEIRDTVLPGISLGRLLSVAHKKSRRLLRLENPESSRGLAKKEGPSLRDSAEAAPRRQSKSRESPPKVVAQPT